MRTLEEIKRTVETGLGRFPCELKLANVQLVNVFSGEIYPTDIYIQNKRVVSIEPGLTLEAEKNVDCGGAYAVPGFIDSHMHFESTMLSPEALATVVVPQGTTTLCADLMEIANVAGEEGLRAMLTCMDRLPYGARYRPDRRADHQSRSDPHASGEAGGNPARSVAGYFEAGRCGALRKDRRCGRGLCAGLYAEKRRAGIFHEPRPPQHCDRWRQRQRYGDYCQRGCPTAWRTDRGLRRQRDGLHVLADRRLDERMWRRRGDAPSRRHE